MKVFIVISKMFGDLEEIKKVFSTQKAAEAYVLSNGGFGSEMSGYEIYEEVVY